MGSGANSARDPAGRRRTALVSVLCVILAGAYVVPMKLGVVCGESMSPALHHGQLFLMSRARRGGRLRRGDVVVLDVKGQQHIKRIYALPGDYIATDKELDVLPELARRRPGVGEFIRMTVPPGHVFVLGDATTRSYDSRHFGPVPVEKVTGRLLATLFTVPQARRAYTTAMAREIENRPQASDPLD
jgi:signal peptidase I